MKDISTNTLTTIISMASVVVFLILGFLGSFQYSWLTFMVAGILIVSIRMIRRDKENAEKGSSQEETKQD